jgi:YegS/Rv2252/BmrU family lipid kinase
MPTRVILNPWADHGRARGCKDSLLALANEYDSVDCVLSEAPGHASELAIAAAERGFDRLIAAGGDGTVHEIVNGLHRCQAGELSLGLVPIGSGNDFAYGLGLLAELEPAVRRAFSGTPRPVDLAVVQNDQGKVEVADNSIGIGFDATITIQSKTITRIHGFAMYGAATLQTIALYYQTPELDMTFDQEHVRQETLMVSIGLGPRAGGGFLLTPEASHDDGLLDSCTVNPIGRATMLQMLPRVMKGTHVTSRHVTMRRSRRLTLKSNMALPVHIDGEIHAYPADNVRELDITSLPAALSVIF